MKLHYSLSVAGAVMGMLAVACSSSTSPGTGGAAAAGGGTSTAGTAGGGTGGGGGASMGTKTCNDLLNGDPASADWSTSDSAADFTTAGGSAYDALNQCACQDSTPTGCKDVCTMGLNGTTTPNFCDSGKTPNQNTSATSCYGCLMTTCGAQIADCKSN